MQKEYSEVRKPLRDLILTNGVIIDGTGAAPIFNAAIAIHDGLIQAVGNNVLADPDANIIDVQGRFILPGFFNTHVHRAFKADLLRTWAQEGITTIRDLGASLRKDQFIKRDKLMQYNRHARLLSVGPMISTVRGYGTLEITSPENARKEVYALAKAGADLIKIGIEDHINRRYRLISLEEIRALVEAAHFCNLRVSAHVTRTHHLSLAVEGGVDEIAHMVRDQLPDSLIEKMVQRNIFCIPTLELWSGVSQMHNSNCIVQVTENLQRFIAAGGQVALGTDYAGYGCEFELGMPLKEMKLMQAAGMTAMQIILAGTRNAAKVCGLHEHGTLEVGKNADVLVVDRDPLQAIDALKYIFLVIHNGERIK
jgi:imidazolonepropionase-like amidohydrolase